MQQITFRVPVTHLAAIKTVVTGFAIKLCNVEYSVTSHTDSKGTYFLATQYVDDAEAVCELLLSEYNIQAAPHTA